MKNNQEILYKGAWDQLQHGIHTTNIADVPSFEAHYYMVPDGESIIFMGLNDIFERFSLTIPHDPHSKGDLIGTFDPGVGEFSGIDFSNDGKIMILLFESIKEIRQYTVPVPYDFTSIVDAPVSFDTTPITANNPSKLVYSRDGDFVFFTDLTNLFSLPLPIPFDVTSFIPLSDTIFALGAINAIDSFTFKPEGDIIYVLNQSPKKIIEYTLTSYDITTMVKTVNELPLTEFFGASDISFRSNGDQFYVFFVTSAKFVRYHLDNSWEINTASHFGNNTPILINAGFGLDIKPDGKKYYMIDDIAIKKIIEYTTPSPWNSSKITKNGNEFDVTFLGGAPMELQWSNDGNHCYYVTSSPDMIYQLDATTPYDTSTLSYNGVSFSPTEGTVSLEGFFILPDEKKFYVLYTNFFTITDIFEYDMPTKGDLANTVYSGNTKRINPTTTDTRAMSMKPDGSQLFIFSRVESGTVHRYTFTINKNISTINFVDKLFTDEADTLVFGIHMKQTDGSKLYSIGITTDQIHEHDLSLEFNNSIINELGGIIGNEEGGIVVSA